MSQDRRDIKPSVAAKVEDNIGYLTFINPSKNNALPQHCWEAIPPQIEKLIANGARVIIVSGEGDSFCAGADISEFDVVRKNTATARIYEQTNINGFNALRSACVPTIAKIRGYCLGGGFGLAAACDLRLCDSSAQFGVPAAKLGLAYPVEAMADIVHSIGAQNTKKMLFTAERYSAAEIHSYGFLGEVVEPKALDKRLLELANKIAYLAPLTHRATKAAIEAALGGDVERAITLGNKTFASKDYAEGRKAFKDKRFPVFKGR
ncbi:MAG: enoyl-CoA hydratase-related protein [Rhizobiaceae bacterium]